MSGTASSDALATTGLAVRRVAAGCLARTPVSEPDVSHVARLAIASVAIPVWAALASLVPAFISGGGDPAAALASLMKLFVLQSLCLVPILTCMRSLREVGALGGNGALPDFALVLHLSAGLALAMAAGDPGAGAAAVALQQTIVYGLSITMILAAAGRGVVEASPVLVAAGVISATMPPCIVILARAGTALGLHVSGFPSGAYATSLWVKSLF